MFMIARLPFKIDFVFDCKILGINFSNFGSSLFSIYAFCKQYERNIKSEVYTV